MFYKKIEIRTLTLVTFILKMESIYSGFNKQLPISIPFVSTQGLCYLHSVGTDKYLAATKNYISLAFRETDFGIVDSVELVVLRTYPSYMIFKAVIHFKNWFSSASNYAIQRRIFEETKRVGLIGADLARQRSVTLMYRPNCFWILETNDSEL